MLWKASKKHQKTKRLNLIYLSAFFCLSSVKSECFWWYSDVWELYHLSIATLCCWSLPCSLGMCVSVPVFVCIPWLLLSAVLWIWNRTASICTVAVPPWPTHFAYCSVQLASLQKHRNLEMCFCMNLCWEGRGSCYFSISVCVGQFP